MNRSSNQEKFIDILTRLNQKIIALGKLNILSNHIYSENFFRDLLNEMYGYSFTNQNKSKSNAEGYDLIDKNNKIILQISSTCSKSKIEATLNKKSVRIKGEENYRLMFTFIGEQNENIKNKHFKAQPDILFNPKEDIILTYDLNKQFYDKSIDNQKKILELLNRELSPVLFEESLKYISEKFIDDHLEESISNLASRYSQENDVETINNKIIEALSITDDFKQKNICFINKIKEITDTILKKKPTFKTEKKVYEKFVHEIETFNKQLDFYLDIDEDFDNKIEVLKEIYRDLDNIIKVVDNYRFNESQRKGYKESELAIFLFEIERIINKYNKYLNETLSECLFTPYLLIQGRAGVGKSHLIGHLAKKLRANKHITYLFLGQFFTKNENPWTQILKNLEIPGTVDDFLRTIDSKAKEVNKRAFIIIDALNEGEGKKIWDNYFQSFINKLKKYSNIAFVFSIRTPFEDTILPKGIIEHNNINTFKHKGFSEEGYEPIRSFCDYYGLELPTFPILNTEYENPLFLKLACEYYKEKEQKFEQNLQLCDIFDNIIERVNVNLSKVDKFDYDKNFNVVSEVVNGIIGLMSKSTFRDLKYSEAFKIVNEISNKYIQRSGKFLEALLDENILSKIENYNGDLIIYFSYERMGDYYLTDYLLEGYDYDVTEEDKSSLIKQMKTDQKLNRYFENPSTISFNQGLIEELSTRLIDNYNIELFEVFPDYEKNSTFIEAFVYSLIWRSKDSINEITKNYINKRVLSREYFRKLFLDVMLMKASQINHPLNALVLNKFLKKIDLSTRDYIWTQYISKGNVNALKIVNWVSSNYKSLGKDSTRLYVIFLAWLLASTNKSLRDKSTKGLVKLFKNHPDLMVEILKLFRENNDPYIIERLYSSIYGGVVRSTDSKEHMKIAKYIYAEVFDKEWVYPHILMRDYARQTIEYIYLKNNISCIKLEKIRPPYLSKWYSKSYSNKEIDEYIEVKKEGLNSKSKEAIDRIVSSMITEYGRGTGGYGDFGRYIFGFSVNRWLNQFTSDQELSNFVIIRVFEMGYDAKLHGSFDISVSPFDRHNNSVERIGKKYQWIAFYELLAKLADNFPTFEIKNIYSQEYYELIEEKTKNPIVFHDDISEEDSLFDLTVNSNFSHIIKDKERYIEKVEKIPNKQYTGPWLDDLRDIDPTNLIDTVKKGTKELIKDPLPVVTTAEWTEDDESINDAKAFLEIDVDNKKYISLVSSFNFEKRENNTKFNERDSIYFYALGCFLKEEDLNNKSWLTSGINIPSPYNVFLYEYYWSESYKDYVENLENGFDENYTFAACNYSEQYESSIEKTLSFYLPNKEIINYFSLVQKEEGIWINPKGEIVCFDSKLLGFNNECLLFDKEKLITFLCDNKYIMQWQVYLQKTSHKNRKEWWFNVSYDGGKYNKNIIKEEVSNLEWYYKNMN